MKILDKGLKTCIHHMVINSMNIGCCKFCSRKIDYRSDIVKRFQQHLRETSPDLLTRKRGKVF